MLLDEETSARLFTHFIMNACVNLGQGNRHAEPSWFYLTNKGRGSNINPHTEKTWKR